MLKVNIIFRTVTFLVLLFVNISSAHDENKELIENLRERGITYITTSKVIIYGSPADYGTKTIVNSQWTWLIQEIWDKIYESRPHSTWTASNYLKLELCTKEKGIKAILYVNATDNCFLNEKDKKGYRCPGLYEYLMKVLKYEYETNLSGRKKGQPDKPIISN